MLNEDKLSDAQEEPPKPLEGDKPDKAEEELVEEQEDEQPESKVSDKNPEREKEEHDGSEAKSAWTEVVKKGKAKVKFGIQK